MTLSYTLYSCILRIGQGISTWTLLLNRKCLTLNDIMISVVRLACFIFNMITNPITDMRFNFLVENRDQALLESSAAVKSNANFG